MTKKKKRTLHDVNKLPKNPKKGDLYRRTVNNPKIGKRLVIFEATGKKGFGKYKTVENKPK